MGLRVWNNMNDEPPRKDSPLLRDVILRVVGIFILLAGVWMISRSEASIGQGSVLACIGIVVLLLSMARGLSRFSVSVLKLVDLQAETREVTKEARDATGELRDVAKFLGAEVLKLLVGGGRWGSHGDSQKVFDRSEELLRHLTAMGLSEADVGEVKEGVKPWVIVDYCGVISKLAQAKRNRGSDKIWNDFWRPWSETINRPNPDVLGAWLEENGWIDADIEEWLHDYRHFVQFGEHRRPEFFRDRDDVVREAERAARENGRSI